MGIDPTPFLCYHQRHRKTEIKKRREKMRIWKMVGGLGLLVVIICSCVLLANPTEISATEEPDSTQSAQNGTTQNEDKESGSEQAVTVEKSYSEGLSFRSNGDGTCVLSGLGSCKDSYLLIPPKSPNGDTVVGILAGALKSESVSAVEIPATVTALDADSFAGCTQLAHVRIASGNKDFLVQDGALYSADGKTLLYCPVARGARELSLHRSLTHVAAGAFARCPQLTTIYFAGSSADWRSIRIGDDNDALYEAAFKFNAN
jgi:hypothetical protein